MTTGLDYGKPIVSVFDGDFIPFYVCHNKKGESLKTLDDCIALCDDFIGNINKAVEADYYIGFLTKGKCFRYQVNSDYKANRKYADMPPYTFEVREYLTTIHNFTSIEGYEADDCVVSFKEQYKDYDSIIVSPDKDILNLEGSHFNPRRMKFENTSKGEADEYFWRSMIIGDPGDNVKGIPGKGKAYADKVFEGIKFPAARVLKSYVETLGEYKGIQEYYKNYLSLKLVDTVTLKDIQLNKINKMPSEQT